ncbi:hypothetical protein [Pantoea sp. AS142]|uniref:hypothetical protein n=1 Tax=Pantoea sp. AS142 TaxID=3081292 RepID=UPI00301A32F8
MPSQLKIDSLTYCYKYEPANKKNMMLFAGIEGLLSGIQQESPDRSLTFLFFFKENIRELLPMLEVRQVYKRHIIISDSVMLPLAYFFASRNRALCIIEPTDTVQAAQEKLTHCFTTGNEYDVYLSSLKSTHLKIFHNFFSGIDANSISLKAGVSLKRTYGIRKEVENQLGITVRKLQSCSL